MNKADIEFYEAPLVRRTALLLSKRDPLTWETLSHRSRQRWLNRAVDFLYGLLNDPNVANRLPHTARSLRS